MLSDRQIWTRTGLVLLLLAGATTAALLLRRGPAAASPRPPAAPVPSAQRHLPSPGETDRYALYLNDMAAGRLQTSFASAAEGGRPGLEFRYELEPTGALQVLLRYKLTGRTLMDPQTLRALWGRFTSRSGDHEKITTVRFEPAAAMADVKINKPYKNSLKHKRLPIATPLDVPAALVLLRTADWSRGPAAFSVLSSDDLYQWRVRYLRRESVKVPAGRFDTDALLVDAHKMDLKAGRDPVPEREGHSVRVWLARDSGVLVRVEAEMSLGTFRADLE